MNARGFQALVSQLGELSAVQREALISALKRRLPLTTRISAETAVDQFDRLAFG